MSDGGTGEREEKLYHERANHEDNLHVNRTYVFISLNGFVAVAVGFTTEPWLRLIFSGMALSVALVWSLWARNAKIFIRALRDAGQNRVDEILWQKLPETKGFFKGGALNIMSIWIPWVLFAMWIIIFIKSGYEIYRGHGI